MGCRRCLSIVAVLVPAIGLGFASAEQVAPGVNYTVYSAPGPNVVHVVAFERSRSEYKLVTGWPQKKRNYTARWRVSQTAAQYDNPAGNFDVLAATNGAYFDPVNLPAVIGTAAGGGDIHEPPDVNDNATDTLFFGPSRVPAIRSDIGHLPGTLTFANNTSIPLDYYNLYPPPIHAVTAYTQTWDTSTRSSFVNPSIAVEVVLTGVTYPMRGEKEISGIVSAIHTPTAGNATIPPGGMVLTAWGSPKNTIVANTAVGDRLRMRFRSTVEEYNNADFSMTGIGWIISNGVKQTANWSARPNGSPYSRNPRTVLGWGSQHVFMVVCDGRTSTSVGMTFDEMANFLTGTLGCTDAINLDGGGSSTMWVNGSVRNVPSDGSERAVSNVVLLVKQVTATSFPVSDPFAPAGRISGWDDKFFYADVFPFVPPSPGGDGHVLRVRPATGSVDTVRRGDFGDTDYSIQADIYCQYRPEVAGDGFERCGIFARDSGTGAFGLSSFGGGNCYALVYDSHNGRIQAGRYVNGTLIDLLPAPMYAPSTAWRQFRIDCYGSLIRYRVDGTLIHSAVDTTFARGSFGIGYHEFFTTDSNALGTRADNFTAFVDTSGLPPVADFTGTPTTGIRPLNVQFTDASTGSGITQWHWDFGDTTTSNLQNPIKTYSLPGTYTVSLTVTNAAGSDTRTRADYIQVLPTPGDLDSDGDVDLDDFGIMQTCLTGSGVSQNDPACARARFDGDSDVDAVDLSIFRGCFSGANIPAVPGCTN